jgi:hypothetical protein
MAARAGRERLVLPPSSWAADIAGPIAQERGDVVVVPGAGPAKGGPVALAVAQRSRGVRFLLLPGRSTEHDLAPWRALPNAEVASGRAAPESFLARARAVLSPTRAEIHPLTLMEAAVRGIAVVCTDLPSTRAATGGHALFVPDRAPVPIWTAILARALAGGAAPRLRLPPYAETVQAFLERFTPARSAAA